MDLVSETEFLGGGLCARVRADKSVGAREREMERERVARNGNDIGPGLGGLDWVDSLVEAIAVGGDAGDGSSATKDLSCTVSYPAAGPPG